MNFDIAFDRLISHEGGYVNHPNDPGGETKFGICKRSYPDVNIAGLTVEGAKAIYKRDFWDVLGEDIHPAIKFQVFDFAVNSGIQTAIRKLQSAIGVADDGHWGPASAAALQKINPADVIMLYVAERLDFWRKLSTWATFGSGWAGRAANDLRFATKDA
jgi:hypothetical protein